VPDFEHPALPPYLNRVLPLLMSGATNDEIASTLFIAESTAATYVRRIADTLGIEPSGMRDRSRRVRIMAIVCEARVSLLRKQLTDLQIAAA
jgi:DNA-binding NarL/FixJ family response regulator